MTLTFAVANSSGRGAEVIPGYSASSPYTVRPDNGGTMQGPVTVAASAKLGKVIDLAWVPLPAPIGGGSVVIVAGEDGSLAVVDATQTVEHRSLKKRLAAFKNLVGGRWPFPQVLLQTGGHS